MYRLSEVKYLDHLDVPVDLSTRFSKFWKKEFEDLDLKLFTKTEASGLYKQIPFIKDNDLGLDLTWTDGISFHVDDMYKEVLFLVWIIELKGLKLITKASPDTDFVKGDIVLFDPLTPHAVVPDNEISTTQKQWVSLTIHIPRKSNLIEQKKCLETTTAFSLHD